MKKYIYGMSFSRKDVLDRLKGMRDQVNSHIIKCVVYKDSLGYLDHWASEVGGWLNRANRAKSKVKLKEKDYYNSLFSPFGDDISDADINLDYFRNYYCYKHHKYPDFEITDELVKELYDVYTYILTKSMDVFLGNEILSASAWKSIVLDAIKECC